MLTIQKHKYRALYSAIFGAALLLGSALPARADIQADNQGAVLFVYQRIGDEATPQSNISLDLFKEHIRELKTGGYSVLPLADIVSALKTGDTLPQKTVGITFEGADASTLDKALPLLEENNLPYAVFFASDLAEGSSSGHLDWKRLEKLKNRKLATLGILPAAYAHMIDQDNASNAALINRATARYREIFGEAPRFFAYPYGEISAEVRKLIGGYEFAAAFGQQSGVAHTGSDILALPRFTMTDNFGDLDRFRLTAGALPLPVTDIMPDDMRITENPPMIGFTITPELTDTSKLSCFISGHGKAELARLGGNRVEIRLIEPLSDRRTRINCTMPDNTIIPGQPQSWRWFGMLMTDPSQGEAADVTASTPSDRADIQPDTSENVPDQVE